MRVIIDRKICMGCLLCSELCPDVFKMRGEKAAASKEAAGRLLECAKNAAAQCPVEAIAFVESDIDE